MNHSSAVTAGLQRTESSDPAGTLPPGRTEGRFGWLAPMALWPLAQHFIPKPRLRPQGGGTQRTDDQAMLAAILYTLVSECPWRALPKVFGVSWQTAHRRFGEWSQAGLWQQVREASRSPQCSTQTRYWAFAVAEAAAQRHRRAAQHPRGMAPADAPEPRADGRGNARGLRPAIRVHEQRSFTARLFGPRHGEPGALRQGAGSADTTG